VRGGQEAIEGGREIKREGDYGDNGFQKRSNGVNGENGSTFHRSEFDAGAPCARVELGNRSESGSVLFVISVAPFLRSVNSFAS
jgi:hypothetical protein